MNLRKMILGMGLALAVVLLLAGWQLFGQPYRYQGSVIDPPVTAADFELVDQHGEPFRLSEQRGKVVLVFFGYTNCPDVCPLTLVDYKHIRAGLGEQADQVRLVFVTVDPARDTVERLNTQLSIFDPAIVGLTGEQADLEAVYQSYGVYYAKQETGSAAGYLVDHTARTYVIDQDGKWRMTFPFELEWEAMLQDVRHLLREG